MPDYNATVDYLRKPTEAEIVARAERRAKALEKRKRDAPAAMAEYRAREEATLKRMLKLRAERIAREVSAAVAPPQTRAKLAASGPGRTRRGQADPR